MPSPALPAGVGKGGRRAAGALRGLEALEEAIAERAARIRGAERRRGSEGGRGREGDREVVEARRASQRAPDGGRERDVARGAVGERVGMRIGGVLGGAVRLAGAPYPACDRFLGQGGG